MLYDQCFFILILVTNALVQEKTLEKPSEGEDKSDAPQEKLAFKDDAKPISASVLKSFYKYERRDIEMQSGPDKTSLRKVNTEEFWNRELLKSFGDPGKPEEIDFDKATRHLHKMVRHWLGLRQDCEDLLAQLKFLQKTYIEIKEKRDQDWVCDRRIDAGEKFDVLISQCDICVRWTQVYHDRTNIRINLVRNAGELTRDVTKSNDPY